MEKLKGVEEKITKKNNKGQVTIFIIIAILIVIAAVLIYWFYPQLKATFLFNEENPSAFLQNCMEDELTENIEKISLHGGSLNPEHYILYNNYQIEYLCYTGEYYKTCVMQQPMLKAHIEEEIKKSIEVKSKECLDKLKINYESKGYQVRIESGEIKTELTPKKITISLNSPLTTIKGETKKYNSFDVILNNNLYELISIANSILNWEARYGDAETTIYMNYYKDIKVEKKKQSEGSTIYILTERSSQNKFQFASRSVAWAPGYGVKGVERFD